MSKILQISFTSTAIDEIKQNLSKALPNIKSSHLTEAIASGFGFNSNAALRSLLKNQETHEIKLNFNTSSLVKRLVEFNYQIPADFEFLKPYCCNNRKNFKSQNIIIIDDSLTVRKSTVFLINKHPNLLAQGFQSISEAKKYLEINPNVDTIIIDEPILSESDIFLPFIQYHNDKKIIHRIELKNIQNSQLYKYIHNYLPYPFSEKNLIDLLVN